MKSNEEKSIYITEFSDKKTDWESWSNKFLLHGKWNPTQDKYQNALEGDADLDEKIIKLCELKELLYEDLILFSNTSSSVGKVAFGLVRNAKSADFLEGNCKIVWDRMVSKYTPVEAQK